MDRQLGMLAQTNYPEVCAPRNETIRERLERQLKAHNEWAENIKSAIKFMDENPNFENFHNLVSKIGC